MVCPLAGKNWATDRKKAKKRQLTEGMTEKTLTYLTVLLSKSEKSIVTQLVVNTHVSGIQILNQQVERYRVHVLMLISLTK